MSRREDIDNAVWDDEQFAALSPHAKLLYFWTFTNPRCGMAGLYKIPAERVGAETGLTVKQAAVALAELAAARFVLHADGVLWVRSRVKHLRSKSPQMAKSIAADVRAISGEHPLRGRFLAEYGDAVWLRDVLADVAAATVSTPYEEPIGNLSEKPVDTGDADTLSGTYREVPGTGHWQGQVVDVSSTATSTADTQKNQQLSDEPPDGFPDELLPHLDAVVPVLNEMAARHAAPRVTRYQVARTMLGQPRRRYVAEAHNCAAYFDGRRRVRDVNATYRNWLGRCDELAAVEPLLGGTVYPLRPRRETVSELLQAIEETGSVG